MNFVGKIINYVWEGVIGFIETKTGVRRLWWTMLIIVVTGMWLLSTVAHLPVFDKRWAEAAGQKHFAQFGIKVHTLVCTKDTPDAKGYKDGWSTCTYTLPDKPNKMLTLRCPTDIIFTPSCKQPRTRIINQQ